MRFRAALVGAAAMIILMTGTVPGHADALADKFGAFDTDDGWQVSLYKTDEQLKRWPNLAATAFSREAFVSVKATARH